MDNTHYGIPDPELTAVIEGLGGPAVLAPPQLPPLELQTWWNDNRIKTNTPILAAFEHQVTWRNSTAPGSDGYQIPIRIYEHPSTVSQPHIPIFIDYHGGGFIFGNLDTEHYFCILICQTLAAAGHPINVISVDYRKTPQYAHPCQVNDAWDAFDYICKNTVDLVGREPGDSKIVIGGTSAGAALATGVCIKELWRFRSSTDAGDENRIHAAWFSIPPTCLPEDWHKLEHYFAPGVQPSWVQCASSVGLNSGMVKLFSVLMKIPAERGPDDLYNVALVPVEDLKGHPKCTFQLDGMDPLRDLGYIYATNLKDAGVDVLDLTVYPGLPHGHWRFPTLTATKKYVEDTIRNLKNLSK